MIGTVTAPSAVLIRPDGYVAWVADDSELGLAEALSSGSARLRSRRARLASIAGLVLPLPARPAVIAVWLVRGLPAAADRGTRLPLSIQLEVALEQQRSTIWQPNSRRHEARSG